MTSEEIRAAENKLLASDNDLIDESQTKTEDAELLSSTSPKFVVDKNNSNKKHEYQYIPLRMGGNGGTHKPSEGSRYLLENEVSLEDLENMTTKFYDLAFQDETLDKFIRSHSDPHGSRFAKWIHQKLTDSNLWDLDRQSRDLTPHQLAGGRTVVVHDRSSAHASAWYSPKRPAEEVGRHFKLDECRVWMRLHFWALRQSGLIEKSPSFVDYYVRFIGHFVSVYEGSAPAFARESFRWSGKLQNIDKYISDGRKMNDVLSVSFWNAARDLPEEELNDEHWPYHVQQ